MNETNNELPVVAPIIPYVITGVDEGIQINYGTRLGFVGAGLDLPAFEMAGSILREILAIGETPIYITSSLEDQWQDDHLQSKNPATIKEKYEEFAAKSEMVYAGVVDFGDPKVIGHSIKGHVVRPQKIHVADSIGFTCGGGEQIYNLRNYLICAEWLYKADYNEAKKLILTQIEYCRQIAGKDLKVSFETEGVLGEEIALQNKEIVEKIMAEAKIPIKETPINQIKPSALKAKK